MRRMLEMHKEQRSQWKRDAIDLSVDPTDHAGEDLPSPPPEQSRAYSFLQSKWIFSGVGLISCRSFDFQSANRKFPDQIHLQTLSWWKLNAVKKESPKLHLKDRKGTAKMAWDTLLFNECIHECDLVIVQCCVGSWKLNFIDVWNMTSSEALLTTITYFPRLI